MKRLAQALGLALALHTSASAEYYDSPRPVSFSAVDGLVAGVNIAASCIIGGSPHLVRGRFSKAAKKCAQGAVGGVLIYGGLKAASLSSTPGLAWTGQILVNDGASIRENAALGEGFFDELGYTFGPIHLQFSPTQKKYFEGWYLDSLSLVGMGIGISEHANFDLKLSLYSGTLVFTNDDPTLESHTVGNTLILNQKHSDMRSAYEHEIVHVTEYRSYGTMDLALQNSRTYQDLSDKFHLRLGGHAGVSLAVLLSEPFPYYHKPTEFSAGELTVYAVGNRR